LAAWKVGFVTLGCDKNRVDTEYMLGALKQEGYTITDNLDEADVLIVNTCGFIDAAVEESVYTIMDLAEKKEDACCRALIVTGCLAQRYRDTLEAEIPEIDALVGTGDFGQINQVVKKVLEGEKVAEVGVPEKAGEWSGTRFLTTPVHSTYVKIAEGCNKTCTFCVIPRLRGRYRSRQPEEIEKEVRWLVRQGTREVNLVAQDVTRYGRDLPDGTDLPGLLKRLARVDGLKWIRLLYASPEGVTDELLEVVASEDKVCRYLDLPIQHGSPRILKEMGRPSDPEGLMARIDEIRKAVPGISLRTSLIVGFPGETEREFQDLLDFIDEASFDYAGFFIYSPEEGTPAGGRKDQVPVAVKEERYDRAMEHQRLITRRRNARWVGQRVPVLIDEASGNELVGRTQGQAPEVDGQVLLGGRTGRVGAIVMARIQGVLDYDLVGEIIEL